MNRRITIERSVLAATLLTLLGVWAWAGPLDPPAGPVASSFKTLTEVEPRIAINATNTPGDADSIFKITSRGSYYLTGQVKGVSGKSGIEIAASDVTIDLNGYNMIGVSGSLDGIVAPALVDAIDIHGGSITGWADGISITLTSRSCRISNVSVTLNSEKGINVGDGAVVSGCTAVQNGDAGISVNAAGSVTNCTAKLNLNDGIQTGAASVISECTSQSNSANGIQGSGFGCTISNCSAANNSLSGFQTVNGATVVNCSAHTNTRHGFELDSGCNITGCTALNNGFDGIIAVARCTIQNNACNVNGLGTRANIHVTSFGNRIDGNNAGGGNIGIDVDAVGNLIVRNSCRLNTTNFSIVAGNTLGGIIAAGTNAAAINGSSAAGTIGTNDPWSNVSY